MTVTLKKILPLVFLFLVTGITCRERVSKEKSCSDFLQALRSRNSEMVQFILAPDGVGISSDPPFFFGEVHSAKTQFGGYDKKRGIVYGVLFDTNILRAELNRSAKDPRFCAGCISMADIAAQNEGECVKSSDGVSFVGLFADRYYTALFNAQGKVSSISLRDNVFLGVQGGNLQ